MSPIIENTTIQGNAQVLDNATVYDSTLRDNSIVKDYAVVRCCSLYDHAMIMDDAVVHGVILMGDAKIVSRAQIASSHGITLKGGVWARSPVILSGLYWPVYECECNQIGIGCYRYSFEEWKKLWEDTRGKSNRYGYVTVLHGRHITKQAVRNYWEAIKCVHTIVGGLSS